MFIPAFVLSLFLISIYEFFTLDFDFKVLKTPSWTLLKLFAPSNKKYNFILATKDKNWIIEFLYPDNNNSYFLELKDYDFYLYIFWSFDIFRKKIHIWKFDFLTTKELNNYFYIKKYAENDNLDKVDAKKTSIFNHPYLKLEENHSLNNKKNIAIIFESNLNLELKWAKSLDLIHFILILLWSLWFLIEWQDIFFSFYLFLSFLLTYYYKQKNLLLTEKSQKKVTLFVFFIMLFLTVIYRDMSWSWSVFLIQLLLISFLTKNGYKNSFLYMFLMLFVFVAISLFSSHVRFILLFLWFLLISTYLLFFISWDETYQKFNYKIGSKLDNKLIFKTFFLVLFWIIIFYFLLPHWAESKNNWWLRQSQTGQSSGFSDEVNLQNVSAISLDESKIFVVSNISQSDVVKLGLKYFRWARLNIFNWDSWSSSFKADLRQFIKNNKQNSKTNLEITYFPKSWKNIFIPWTVLNIDWYKNYNYYNSYNYFNIWNDNTILKTDNQITNNLTLDFDFKTDNWWKILDNVTKINDFDIVLNEKTLSEFQKYFESIPNNIISSPDKLTDYVKLKSWFSYSITNPAKNIDDFLYKSKKWHCEYFATVLAVTLQHFWYKATVVNWYVWEEYNSMANSLIIRWKNAHSWVEIYDENSKSWKIYDATPPDYLDFSTESKTIYDYIKPITNFYDYLDIKWYTYIINFTWDEQKKLYIYLINHFYFFIILFLFIAFLKKIISFFKIFFNYFKLSKKQKIAFLFSFILQSKNNFILEIKKIDILLFEKYQKYFYWNSELSFLENFIDLLKIIKLKYFKKQKNLLQK